MQASKRSPEVVEHERSAGLHHGPPQHRVGKRSPRVVVACSSMRKSTGFQFRKHQQVAALKQRNKVYAAMRHASRDEGCTAFATRRGLLRYHRRRRQKTAARLSLQLRRLRATGPSQALQQHRGTQHEAGGADGICMRALTSCCALLALSHHARQYDAAAALLHGNALLMAAVSKQSCHTRSCCRY